MKLEKFKDKSKSKRKVLLISLGLVVLISVSLLLYKTFASFNEHVEFSMMNGKVDYFGNSDIYFVFYKGNELLKEMPQKDNKENLVFERGSCDNGASIEWNVDEWAPLVKGLTSPKTKCSLYFVKDTKAIRKISTSNSDGMWGYKDKLTKIVIENTKSVKEAPEGGKVYGPFDESEYKSKAVESYVVCEANDTNCIGYLQSDGKVVANSYSDYLFAGLSKITEIAGLENLDTSNVISMVAMFAGMSSLNSLDLSSFNTSHVTSTEYIFSASSNLISLNLSNWDLSSLEFSPTMFSKNDKLQTIDMTNFIFPKNCSNFFEKLQNLESVILENSNTINVTNMYCMFAGCTSLTNLNLKSWDTRQVTNMNTMFAGNSSLQTIKFGSKFVHKSGASTSGMFSGCPASDRPTDSSWQGVSF